ARLLCVTSYVSRLLYQKHRFSAEIKNHLLFIPASTSNMTSPKAVIKSIGPKLVPFFKTVSIYFVLFIPSSSPSWLGVLVKCLPVVSLCIFVLLHGMSLSDEFTFSRRILIGLIFSCFGDAFLIFPQYFKHGMMSFAVAQMLYTSAFGFHPINPYAGCVCYAFGAAVFYILLPGLDGSLAIMVGIYQILLVTMAWRAIARVQLFEELWTWTKLCSCAGGVLFMISDCLIGFDHFHSPIPYSQVIIMITYYAAQLGIALSVVDSRASLTSKATPKTRQALAAQ
uniref:lysoplasmalogenase n=1 Tax=Strigamia maritima TaxID=126957 RepID=T1JLT3_STRMM